VDAANHAIEVHGNQYGLLASSDCFKSGNKLTCTTCHDPHKQERGNTAIFSERCQTCHTESKHNFCSLANTVAKENLVTRCVDCHMPAKASKLLNVKINGEIKHRPAVIRSHFISIYPDVSKTILDSLKLGTP
jgi:hypothetical protein